MLTNVRFLASTIQDETYFQGDMGFTWVMDYGSGSLEKTVCMLSEQKAVVVGLSYMGLPQDSG